MCGRQRSDLTPCSPGLSQPFSQSCTFLMQLLEGEFLLPFAPGQDQPQVLPAAYLQLRENMPAWIIWAWSLWPFLAGKGCT